MSYPLETLAAILANRFNKIDLLSSSRDEYVLTARAGARDRHISQDLPTNVFLSYSRQDQKIAREISGILREHGFFVVTDVDSQSLEPGKAWQGALESWLDRADALVVLVSPGWLQSSWAQREFEYFLRQSLRSDSRKPIIPILLPGSTMALQDLEAVRFRWNSGSTRNDRSTSSSTRFFNASLERPRSIRRQRPADLCTCFFDRQDLTFVDHVTTALRRWDVDVSLPLFEGSAEDVKADFEESLMYSDSVIVCWGMASEAWLRATIRQMHLVRAKREKPWNGCTLILAPPPFEGKSLYLQPQSTPIIDVVLDWTDSGAIEAKLASLERIIRS